MHLCLVSVEFCLKSHQLEFPGTAGYGSRDVTAAAKVAPLAGVLSLAQELPHVLGAAKKQSYQLFRDFSSWGGLCLPLKSIIFSFYLSVSTGLSLSCFACADCGLALLFLVCLISRIEGPKVRHILSVWRRNPVLTVHFKKQRHWDGGLGRKVLVLFWR